MRIELHQALYGYDDGHRLLAASQAIDERATRDLRAVTDMAFDGESDTYLTCVPVPALSQQALVRSWPAHEAPRPGSVWSHVLFLDFVDLGEMADIRTLLELFRRPTLDATGFLETFRYTEPLVSEVADFPGTQEVGDPTEVARLLWATYGDASHVVRASPRLAEDVLVAIWEQQWPRLRRGFRFRTRYRTSEQASFAFDVQVVERLTRDQSWQEPRGTFPLWLERLSVDLQRPSGALRDFLRRYGPESERGLADIAPLTQLEAQLHGPWPPSSTANLLCSAFPERHQMATLKRDLLGPAGGRSLDWDASELQRLGCIVTAHPASALDLKALEFNQRVDRLWVAGDGEAASFAAASFAEDSSPAQQVVVASAIAHAGPVDIAVFARQDPDLADAVLDVRTDLLSADQTWRGSPASRDAAWRALNRADPMLRAEILVESLRVQATAAASGCIELEPTLWWRALSIEASKIREQADGIGSAAPLMRGFLERAGHSSIGSPPLELRDPAELALIAVTLRPDAGLWRLIPAEGWARAAADVMALADGGTSIRAALVLFLATRTASAPKERRALWLASFAPLHQASLRGVFDKQDSRLLAKSLGIEGSDGIAQSLRKTAAREAQRNEWPASDVRDLLAGAHPYETEMAAMLRPKSKKRKSWFRELLDLLP